MKILNLRKIKQWLLQDLHLREVLVEAKLYVESAYLKKETMHKKILCFHHANVPELWNTFI